MNTQIDQETQDKLDAATFRRLLKHLNDHKEVQNIDLMILANFCRNCLGKWYKTAADDLGVEVSDNEARERIYGMPYSQWKEKHQQPASEEQLAAFEARQKK
ncbi:DUF1244 domain-containing protein [Endozoicomonas sp. ALB032]|uniref:DUF1244 domain-containing protein n=1 Tax=Endozoicomonas sp. ALB032 TaxID=3403082 RepID=UPI003BB6F8BB